MLAVYKINETRRFPLEAGRYNNIQVKQSIVYNPYYSHAGMAL